MTFPIHVPAGGTVSLPSSLEVLAPGAFSASEQLFLEGDGAVRTVTLSLRGEAREPTAAEILPQEGRTP
jgi:hypothetical protein